MSRSALRVSVILLSVAFAVLLACAAGAVERFDFPPAGPYQVLRCDFHTHTVISDGRLTARERV